VVPAAPIEERMEIDLTKSDASQSEEISDDYNDGAEVLIFKKVEPTLPIHTVNGGTAISVSNGNPKKRKLNQMFPPPALMLQN